MRNLRKVVSPPLPFFLTSTVMTLLQSFRLGRGFFRESDEVGKKKIRKGRVNSLLLKGNNTHSLSLKNHSQIFHY